MSDQAVRPAPMAHPKDRALLERIDAVLSDYERAAATPGAGISGSGAPRPRARRSV